MIFQRVLPTLLVPSAQTACSKVKGFTDGQLGLMLIHLAVTAVSHSRSVTPVFLIYAKTPSILLVKSVLILLFKSIPNHPTHQTLCIMFGGCGLEDADRPREMCRRSAVDCVWHSKPLYLADVGAGTSHLEGVKGLPIVGDAAADL